MTEEAKQRGRYFCGYCTRVGHNKRTCDRYRRKLYRDELARRRALLVSP